MSRRFWISTVAGALTATVIILIALSNNLISSLEDADKWSGVASLVFAIGVLVTTLIPTLRKVEASESRDADAKDRLAMLLIRSLATVERKAQDYLRRPDAADRVDPVTAQSLPRLATRPIALRQIAEIMQRNDFWTSEDLLGFDLAVRARNAIVHGDIEKLEMLDIRYAHDKVQQLLSKMPS